MFPPSNINKPKEGTGLRYNTGKPRLELIPPDAMIEVAKVWTFGSEKYDDFNWRKGIKILSILGCIMRHTAKILEGEDVDEESKCLHAAHIICNCQMLISFYNEGRYKDLDDRYRRK